jgi:capsular exopolysaccharide synthesis family protein
LLEKLKNTVGSRKTIEDLCAVPIIGTMGVHTGIDPLVIKEKPRSALAESIRTIRTNLKYFTGEGSQRVILVTSSVGSEGKTFSALNIAGSMAIAGNRAIILGMDLRKPKLCHTMGLPEERGLSSYLIGKYELEEVIQPSQTIPGLDVIAAGLIPPNPSELIMNSRLAVMFDMLKTKYDHIVIDSPPIGLVTDGYLLAKHADAVIYVVRQHVSKKAHLKMLNEIHKANKLPNLSIIFNAVKKDRESYYGNFGHTYGYGYFEEEEKSPARQILNKTKELLSEN